MDVESEIASDFECDCSSCQSLHSYYSEEDSWQVKQEPKEGEEMVAREAKAQPGHSQPSTSRPPRSTRNVIEESGDAEGQSVEVK